MSTPNTATRCPLRVAMVAHSVYERDNRVMRVAQALAERGDRVEVLALRGSPEDAPTAVLDGVRVHRLQDRFDKAGGSPWQALLPLLRFTWRAARGLQLLAEEDSSPWDLVHVHNVPDFLVLAALPARLQGARVILDLHDLVPEFYASRFAQRPGWTKPLAVTALRACERVSARLADHVIVSNELWHARVARRSAPASKCSVMINHVDERVFRPQPRRRAFGQDGPLLMFPGGLQPHQGLDVAMRAVSQLRPRWPGIRLHLIGEGHARPALERLAQDLQLGESVCFRPPLPLSKVAREMADADIGVVPKLASGFGNEAYSTKIMEFMALGVPLVVSSTRIDRHCFSPEEVRFFEPGNADSMASAIDQILRDPALAGRLAEAGRARAARDCWGVHRSRYLALVDGLVQGPSMPAGRARWAGVR